MTLIVDFIRALLRDPFGSPGSLVTQFSDQADEIWEPFLVDEPVGQFAGER